MKTITAKQLKNRTGEVIKSIKKGEEVLVLLRGVPLGKVVPLSKNEKTPILNQVAGILKGAAPASVKKIREERIARKYKDIH